MSVTSRRRVFAAVTGIVLAMGITPAMAQTAGGWAIVDSDGTLGSNSNVNRVEHPKTGIYRISFNQDVSHCAATATLAAHTGRNGIVPGYVVTGRNTNFPNQIRVYTFNTTTLVPADFRFNVLASC